jgi:hypothetical protein
MSRWFKVISLVIILAVPIAVAGIAPASASATPKIGFFFPDPVRPDEQLPDINDIHDFETLIGRQMDVFLWYESISENFYVDTFRPMAEEGRTIQLAWEPHDFGRDPLNQPDFRLRTITAGNHDAAIRRWARELKAFGYTVYFRPMCEMNGDWVTWGGTVNGNSPGDYIPAWRHLKTIFNQEGANNVKFVWAPNRDGDLTSALNTFNTYYPGDAYVDYVGINGYNWGRLYNTPDWTSEWQMFDTVFGPSYDAFTARTSKPLMIPEMSSTEVGGNKAAWITDAFARLPVRFPRIEIVTWFNIHKETDWPVDSSPASLSAFRAAVALPDSAPPSVDVTAPHSGATLSNDVTVTASASDDRAVSRVDFFLGESLVASDSTAPYSGSITTRGFPNGSYDVKAVAYDAAGNSDEASVPVAVANSTSINYFLSVYDDSSMSSWIIIGNPTETQQVAEVYVAGVRRGTYTIGPRERVTPRYNGLLGGPVKVISRDGGELLVSERSIYNNTFAEVPAVPASELSSEQVLTWYDQASPGMQNWVVITNQGSEPADVEVRIGGELQGRYTVPTGGMQAPVFPGVMNGPVKVTSTNGQPIAISSRVLYNGGFNEVGGKPAGTLASEYNFTWYDEKSAGMKTWIVIGNEGSETSRVGIYIGDLLMGLYDVPAGGRITPEFPGVMNGPVRVISNNEQPMIVSQRSTFMGNFEEVPGTSNAQLASHQWFSWYDNASAGMRTWVLVGNQSQEEAEVDIMIGGELMGHYSIPAGGRVTPVFPGEMNGPVEVKSTAGSPQLVVSQRTIFYNSFDELPGTQVN